MTRNRKSRNGKALSEETGNGRDATSGRTPGPRGMRRDGGASDSAVTRRKIRSMRSMTAEGSSPRKGMAAGRSQGARGASPFEAPADERQRSKAATHLEDNFLVEAGAGTGKTAVLMERLRHIVCSCEVSLEEVVAITFTEKAAAELKSRFREELERWGRKAKGLEKDRISKALGYIDRAAISTIHSFCTGLLMERPVEAGVDPGFRVADEVEAETIFDAAWEQWLQERMVPENLGLRTAFALGAGLENTRTLAMALLNRRDMLDWIPGPVSVRDPRALLDSLRSGVASVRDLMEEGLRNPDDALVSEVRKIERFLESAGGGGVGSVQNGVVGSEGGVEESGDRRKGSGFPQGGGGKGGGGKGGRHEGVGGRNCGREEEGDHRKRDEVQKGCTSRGGREGRACEDALSSGLISLELRKKAGALSSWASREACEEARGILTGLREELSEFRSAYLHNAVVGLAEELRELIEIYQSAKRKRGVLDFDDLLIMARDLLRDSEEARDYFKNKFKFILIDEFQDTDPLQAEVAFFLAEKLDRCAGTWEDVQLEKGKLFLVGDPKQSIYRFRRADIEVYERSKRALCKRGEVLNIRVNFRSTPGVVDPVNIAFEDLMRQPEGGDYQPDYVPLEAFRRGTASGLTVLTLGCASLAKGQALTHGPWPDRGRGLPEGISGSDMIPGFEGLPAQGVLSDSERLAANVGFCPRQGPPDPQRTSARGTRSARGDLPNPWDPSDLGNLSAEEKRGLEASAVAWFVKDAVDRHRWKVLDRETGAERPVRYGDIALLFWATTGLEIYEEALRAWEIPYRVAGGKAFYSRGEVQALVSVLTAIEDPHDGVAVVGALRSPFFGLSDDEIFLQWLRGGSLDYEGAQADGNVGRAFALLRELRRHRNRLSLAAFLDRLFEDTGALPGFYVRPQGEQRVANLLKLSGLAARLEETGPVTFRRFVRWVAEQGDRGVDESESPVREAGDDFVSVLTIHKAKGLEFPVVILPGLWARGSSKVEPILGDRSANRLEINLGTSTGLSTEGWREAWNREKQVVEAERIRLLYVAMTRARDKLVLPCLLGLDQSGTAAGGRGARGPIVNLSSLIERSLAGDAAWAEVVEVPELAFRSRREKPLRVEREARRVEAVDFEVLEHSWQRSLEVCLRRGALAELVTSPTRLIPELGLMDPGEAAASGEAPRSREAPREGETPEPKEESAPKVAVGGGFGTEQLPAMADSGEGLRPPGGRSPGLGRKIGTLVHRLLEALGPDGLDELQALARPLGAQLGLDEESVEDATGLVRGFYMSPFGDRIRSAEAVHREVPFCVRFEDLPVVEGRGLSTAGGVTVEGTADLLLKEHDGWSVVDFKTDRVDEREAAERAAHYRLQGACYALCLSAILDESISEVIFHFLRPRLSCALAVDDALLQEARLALAEESRCRLHSVKAL